MAYIASKVKGKGLKSKSKGPVWKGPLEDGVTQSLLSKFLVCRERFGLLVIKGLKPQDTFMHRVEYGNLWHVCEEALAQNRDWEKDLLDAAKKLCVKYPMQQVDVDHWYRVCKGQFPVYVEYWENHKDVKERIPLLQEEVFKVPYVLPSGRTVTLRGKFDAVDRIGTGIYLQENKTKGDIDERQLQRQLTFDLQTMMYLIALEIYRGRILIEKTAPTKNWTPPIKGVRYNVIRRPLSGGKGTIRQKQTETKDEFYNRLVSEYIAAEPETYFMRWTVDVLPGDYKKFRETFFDPCLEQLCDWWESMTGSTDPIRRNPKKYANYRMPYGVYSPLLDGGTTDLDEYLESGTEVGLQRVTNLFPEL